MQTYVKEYNDKTNQRDNFKGKRKRWTTLFMFTMLKASIEAKKKEYEEIIPNIKIDIIPQIKPDR